MRTTAMTEVTELIVRRAAWDPRRGRPRPREGPGLSACAEWTLGDAVAQRRAPDVE
jgi:hypothetical protein